jgi:hypothetical protein
MFHQIHDQLKMKSIWKNRPEGLACSAPGSISPHFSEVVNSRAHLDQAGLRRPQEGLASQRLERRELAAPSSRR